MSTDFITSDERRLGFVSAVVLAVMAAAVSFGTPGHSSLLPPCPLHALTGLLCPGCGTTRALYYLVHGHPLKAMGENALSILLLPIILFDLTALLTRRWPTLGSRLRPWCLWTFVALVVLFAVLRNLPFVPFLYLAPTDIH